MNSQQSWDLVADIGGTNARFAAVDRQNRTIQHKFHYSVIDHPDFEQALLALQKDISTNTTFRYPPSRVCFAVAAPVSSSNIQFTNSHWEMNRADLETILGCEKFSLINDFAAVAHAINQLSDQDSVQIGGEYGVNQAPVGILGAGTGLGVAGLVYFGEEYQVLETEGGHVEFAPSNAFEDEILRRLRARFGRVSVERLLAGQGILNLYQVICEIRGKQAIHEDPASICEAALAGMEDVARESLNIFCAVMGGVAGNLALTLGARGGIYIAGGIIPRFVDFFIGSEFRTRFDDKGRFANYNQSIPVHLVTKPDLGLQGALSCLEWQNRAS